MKTGILLVSIIIIQANQLADKQITQHQYYNPSQTTSTLLNRIIIIKANKQAYRHITRKHYYNASR
jgi:hypothetical protein